MKYIANNKKNNNVWLHTATTTYKKIKLLKVMKKDKSKILSSIYENINDKETGKFFQYMCKVYCIYLAAKLYHNYLCYYN